MDEIDLNQHPASTSCDPNNRRQPWPSQHLDFVGGGILFQKLRTKSNIWNLKLPRLEFRVFFFFGGGVTNISFREKKAFFMVRVHG